MAPARQASIPLSADLIEAFAGTFLSPLYDNPAPTPEFHRQGWDLYCQPVRLASLVAPREHAKSTAFTHTFVLATVLFRTQDYVIIASATEDLSIGHLEDIAKELRENDDLRDHFLVKSLVVDSKTDIIVEFQDGHQARIRVKGSGQKMRGLKWNGKRPGLVIGDDLEEDEQVENADRRTKFRRWFFRALVPCIRKGGIIRIHGTILHEDSLLARLQKSESWSSLFFRAHRSFSEFEDILWPEQFSEARLRSIRQMFIDQGDSGGYSQEYLNDPLDNAEAYLLRANFLPMSEVDRSSEKLIKVGVDLAVSKKDKANRTSFTVAGKDVRNVISVVDQFVGRWDSSEWVDKFFEIEALWEPDEFIVEGGVIWKAVEPTLRAEMQERDIFLNIRTVNPVRDKASRGRPYQKRHKNGSMRFDKEADWYPEYEAENLKFTGTSDALLDDQFDSTALVVFGFEQSAPVEEEDFFPEEVWEMRRSDPRRIQGRSPVTGY